MTEVLLEQLNNQDLQWIKNNGQRQQVRARESLIQQKEKNRLPLPDYSRRICCYH